jgi:hypothetical protein
MSAYTEQQREDAIEEMMGQRRYVEDFLFQGEADPTEVVILLMSRDLPMQTRDSRDDALIDAYGAQRDALREAFTAYANETPLGQRRSRVDRYLDFHEANRLEDAA